jgi:hypothetical protein
VSSEAKVRSFLTTGGSFFAPFQKIKVLAVLCVRSDPQFASDFGQFLAQSRSRALSEN